MHAADCRLRVEHPLGVGRPWVRNFGAEGILEEVGQVRLRVQVRCDGGEAGLNVFVGAHRCLHFDRDRAYASLAIVELKAPRKVTGSISRSFYLSATLTIAASGDTLGDCSR